MQLRKLKQKIHGVFKYVWLINTEQVCDVRNPDVEKIATASARLMMAVLMCFLLSEIT